MAPKVAYYCFHSNFMFPLNCRTPKGYQKYQLARTNVSNNSKDPNPLNFPTLLILQIWLISPSQLSEGNYLAEMVK